MANVAQLLEEARQLNPKDRSDLIAALYDLSAPLDPAWEAAWVAECADRIAAIERGEMQTHDFDEVLANARARLKQA